MHRLAGSDDRISHQGAQGPEGHLLSGLEQARRNGIRPIGPSLHGPASANSLARASTFRPCEDEPSFAPHLDTFGVASLEKASGMCLHIAIVIEVDEPAGDARMVVVE